MPYGSNIKAKGDFNIHEVLYVDEGGNVGIGADDVDSRLTITGSISTGTLDVNKVLFVSGSTANPRVGIGINTPDAPLHIEGSSLIIATALSGSGTAAQIGEIRWSTGTNGYTYLWIATGSSAWIGISGSAKV